MARRLPSTENDHTDSTMMNSRTAAKKAVIQPVQPRAALSAIASTTPANPARAGASLGSRAPTSADGVALAGDLVNVVMP